MPRIVAQHGLDDIRRFLEQADADDSSDDERARQTAEYARYLVERCEQGERRLAAVEHAAQKLSEVYFEIAAEQIGEDEVRRRRDAALGSD